MLRLIIVRPGSTDFDEQGRIKGTLDVPLNDSGTRQVSETAVSLHAENIEAIYTGPCRAAQQTAEQLAQRADVRFKVVDQLHNLDLGLWSGRRIEDLRQTQPRSPPAAARRRRTRSPRRTWSPSRRRARARCRTP